jgi:hypothetical protein
MHEMKPVILRRCIAAVWIGVLFFGTPIGGRETTSPPESAGHPIAQQRRNVHADLPADASLHDQLQAGAESQTDATDGSLDSPCPCRGAFIDEDSSTPPCFEHTRHPAVLFGSAVLVVAAIAGGWQVYHGHK